MQLATIPTSVASNSDCYRAPSEHITVVLADRHPLTLSGLRSTLANHYDIRVVAECMDWQSLCAALQNHSPNVVLVSGEMLDEDMDLLKALSEESPDTQVILLTGRRDSKFMQDAMRRGARGIFQREKPTHHVPLAIRKVTGGELWFEREFSSHMLKKFLNHADAKAADPDERKIAALTPREHDVIALTCKGLRNKEISSRLNISEATVSHHLTSIFRKLEVDDRIALVIFAVKKRLVEL